MCVSRLPPDWYVDSPLTLVWEEALAKGRRVGTLRVWALRGPVCCANFSVASAVRASASPFVNKTTTCYCPLQDS